VNAQRYQTLASASLIALIALCLAWEGWLAPLRPGGSWMILKGALLLLPLFGILRGKRYTFKWLSLLIQFYLLEGLLRATSDHGLSRVWRSEKPCSPWCCLPRSFSIFARHAP